MFRTLVNKLIQHGGIWFAAMIIHLMSATISTVTILLIGVIVDWFGKNT